jgi:hypothetical protein
VVTTALGELELLLSAAIVVIVEVGLVLIAEMTLNIDKITPTTDNMVTTATIVFLSIFFL